MDLRSRPLPRLFMPILPLFSVLVAFFRATPFCVTFLASCNLWRFGSPSSFLLFYRFPLFATHLGRRLAASLPRTVIIYRTRFLVPTSNA